MAFINSGIKARSKKFFSLALVLSASVLAQACNHGPAVTEVGSHKVFVKRGIMTGVAAVTEVVRASGKESFHYTDRQLDGTCFEVSIKQSEVAVNGTPLGKLKEGDSVFIGADGVTVNDLDYGESEKYLKANVERAALPGAPQN